MGTGTFEPQTLGGAVLGEIGCDGIGQTGEGVSPPRVQSVVTKASTGPQIGLEKGPATVIDHAKSAPVYTPTKDGD